MELSDLQSRWTIASRNISLEKFDGEYVVLDMAVGRYFALTPAASAVLDVLVEGYSPQSVADANPAMAGDLPKLIDTLKAQGILATTEIPPLVPADDEARPLVEVDGALAVEIHDDLADLILADPIHDTDEAEGWPSRKTDA